MRMILQLWRACVHVAARLNARWGKTASHVLRWGVPILLLAILGYSLTQIGWIHVWHARPHALSFYLVLVFPFFVQQTGYSPRAFFNARAEARRLARRSDL